MNLWVVLDSLSNEPEVFSDRDAAISFALDIIRDYQDRWRFDQEEYEDSCADLKNGRCNSECWGTYLGECEVNIFKKSI